MWNPVKTWDLTIQAKKLGVLEILKKYFENLEFWTTFKCKVLKFWFNTKNLSQR